MLNKYRLFFLIAVTFLVEAVILLIVANVIQNEECKLTIIELIIKNTTQLSILMLVTTFVYLFFAALLDISDSKKEAKKSDKSDFAGGVLTRLLIGSFSASTIPTGVSLVLCAFADMEHIKHLSGVEIYIAFAGISLMSIAVLSTYEEEGRISEGIKKVKSSNVSDLTN